MSKPDNAVALDEFPDEEIAAPSSAKSFESEITDALKSMTKGEDGKMHFPEGLREEVQIAANAERRRRDTEGELSKVRSTNKVLTEKVNKFIERVADGLELSLTVEQAEELEDLKRDDPDAWREKLNELEEAAVAELEEELELDDEDVAVVGEVERRAVLLEEYNEENPEFILNDEVFENDLPPRLVNKLTVGEITFEEFLVDAKKFLTKASPAKFKIKTDVGSQEPNLGKAGGGPVAQNTAVEGDIVKSYKNEIF